MYRGPKRQEAQPKISKKQFLQGGSPERAAERETFEIDSKPSSLGIFRVSIEDNTSGSTSPSLFIESTDISRAFNNLVDKMPREIREKIISLRDTDQFDEDQVKIAAIIAYLRDRR